MTEKNEEQKQTADIPDIEAEHARLVDELDALTATRDFFRSEEGRDVKDRLERICKERERNCEIDLRACKPTTAVVAKLQARADAFKEMGLVISGLAWDDEIVDAEGAIAKFAEDNALTLGADQGQEEPEQGEVGGKPGDKITVVFVEPISDVVSIEFSQAGFSYDDHDEGETPGGDFIHVSAKWSDVRRRFIENWSAANTGKIDKIIIVASKEPVEVTA